MATELKTPELSRNAAAAFADKWKSYTDEKQHARGFWSDFFRALCGIDDEEIAGIEYEKRVKSTISGNQEYIDVYWKNVALIEQKSAGENLDKAELQARGYWLSLPPGYRPKTIIISDFLNFRLIDVALNRTHDFPLSKLPENIHRFEAIISGNRTRISEEEITVDQVAAKLMANLYLELEDHGFEGHETSIFLIRILFLLFGDDTGMWAKNTFLKLVMGTKEDGSDVGSKLDTLFEILNTPEEKRPKALGEEFMPFPYVNGGIFAEKISVIDFNKKMRVAFVEVANYDWTTINPTIFGSLFQLIKNKEARRELGEHYTSEENINKIVYPLFLDELQERLAAAWDNKNELKKLRQGLAKIKIFDPACGCGNFLVVSYRHLRQLELELIVRLNNLEGKQDTLQLDGSMGLSITLNQFYGIEIEEWPAQVARMALFLTDHQENLRLERITGATPNRFPIKDYANIQNANALELAWDEFLVLDEQTYILGNPPFVGTRLQSEQQKLNQAEIWKGFKGGVLVDFVTNWFVLGSKFVNQYNCNLAFVSTNSITQGDQPSVLWQMISQYEVEISFAHRTFAWKNESSGQAAVHCVVIGIVRKGMFTEKRLWGYSDIQGEPTLELVGNINAYLLDGPNVLVAATKKPIVKDVPTMGSGNKPRDGGHLSDLTLEEAEEIRATDQIAAKYLRELVGAEELLNKRQARFCLWLVNCPPGEIRNSKILKERVEKVLQERLSATSSKGAAANRPTVFETITQPDSKFIAVPSVSSSKRDYVPVDFLDAETIINNRVFSVITDDVAVFSLLENSTFTTWVRVFSSRMKSDYALAASTVYNTFPFPLLSDSQRKELRTLGQAIMDERKKYPNETLGDLYDPVSMPVSLLRAHKVLDKYVLKIYGLKPDSTESEILETLIAKYSELTSELRLE